jgi:GMP synthase-like glutamine amidotransferase
VVPGTGYGLAKMNVHILQHVPFEDIGCIRTWIEAQKADITYTKFFISEFLPDLKGLDFIVVLGGPMGVNDEVAFPWLRRETEFIHNAVKHCVPILGICLGAQLVASAMGARVYKNAHKEIGWFEVRGLLTGENVFHFPERCLAFHWHGETFDLPPGAIHLAESTACVHQAFQIGRNVIGLQFHLETTREGVHSLIENCRDELIKGPYIQTEKELLQTSASVYAQANSIMTNLLSYITGIAG